MRKSHEIPKDCLSLEQVANVLDYHVQTIYRKIRENKLKVSHIESTPCVKKSELDRYIKQYRRVQ